ncbi:MAG: HAD hydrolase-like protein [Clostridia bacterium]|nr:HAD hydrolase-like protein [Clostridia bacterium]
MRNYDIVLFDFDGTMVDSSEGIFKSLIYALESAGRERPSDETLRKFIGPPLYDSFKNLFGFEDGEIQKMIDKYRERYREKGLEEVEVYEGIPELFKTLKENGVKTATASSKPTQFIERILKSTGLYEYVDYVGGTAFDEKGSGKTAILENSLKMLGCTDRSRAIMVGDRKYDIDGAKGAGLKTIAVLYGFGSEEEFREHKAEYIVKSTKEIEKIILGD